MATVTEVVVSPGGLYFGADATRVRTLLGSCVAVTVWHPRARLGGMCHFVVPSRGDRLGGGRGPWDGRYGDEAIQLLRQHAQEHGTRLGDYQVRMYGGGNQFPGGGPAASICVSSRNADAALVLAGMHRLTVLTADLGGEGARTVVLDLTSGDVTSRRAGTGTGAGS